MLADIGERFIVNSLVQIADIQKFNYGVDLLGKDMHPNGWVHAVVDGVMSSSAWQSCESQLDFQSWAQQLCCKPLQ